MTNEEKLEKLTERLEALAQSAELLASLQVETERRMQRLASVVENIGAATDNLIMIAHDHELRLRAIEGAA